MEIRPVDGERGDTRGGFVVEVLGQVIIRSSRAEAVEAALAILEQQVDKLRHRMDCLLVNVVPPPEGPRPQPPL